MLIGAKRITLTFGYWDDGASFDEQTVICLSICLVASMRLAICGLNRKASPSPSTVRLAGLALVNLCLRWRPLCLSFVGGAYEVPYILGLPHFSSGVFLTASFLLEVFKSSPLCFRCASFFIGCLFNRAPCILGVPLFSSDVF
jgi:hypothetical protein